VREYEEHRLRLPRTSDREGTRELLGLHAEYGGWELARHRIYPDGTRLVTLRRPRRVRPDLAEAMPPTSRRPRGLSQPPRSS
jgi:hypothetical protein